jgi:uncharacterized tellurite resistance protein B-like protein
MEVIDRREARVWSPDVKEQTHRRASKSHSVFPHVCKMVYTVDRVIWFIIIGAVLVVLYLMFRRSGGEEDSSRVGLPHETDTVGVTISVEYSGPSRRQLSGPSRHPDDVWVPPGQSTVVHGVEIPDGMLYVGDQLAAAGGYRSIEPALVDPALAADLANPDTQGEGLDYWPSYSDIAPESRAAYLEWLSGGRRHPSTPAGYVFLFFYGLERRLLVDAKNSEAARADAPRIVAEVERLLAIYGDNESFRGYATNLLAAARVLFESERLYASPPPRTRLGYDLPIDLSVALGQLIVDEHAITGPWAFAWFINHPLTRLRTPAKRCANEFEALFLRRFDGKFAQGMKLKPNKRRLKWDYRPASAGLRGQCSVDLDELPDVRAISRPTKAFQEIADACMQELDAYSRFLGKHPDGAGSIEAFGLLPAELAAAADNDEVKALVTWAEERLGAESSVLLGGAEVMAHWEHAKPDKMSKKEAVAFAHVLAKLNIGIEPDVRFVGPPLSAEGHAVLYRLAGRQDDAPSQEYRASTALLHLAAIVAAADGVVTAEEEKHLESHLEQAMHMNDSEATRLRAHLRWLLAEQPGMAGLKKRLEGIQHGMRVRTAQFALTVAGADGRIRPEEVKVLRGLYKTLGLDPETVYSDIHSLSVVPATEPVTVRAARLQTPGYPIPEPPGDAGKTGPEAASAEFVLDMERVREKLQDTAEVASLLSEIFVQDDPAETALDTSDAGGVSMIGIAGMDAAHSQLLRALVGKSELSRAEFEALAEQMQLLPDGASDVLNEAALEACDAPLLEGSDPIEVDTEILEEMLG